MVVSQIKLVGMLSVLTVTSVMVQSSCVQLNATELSSCPCDGATLTFTLEGKTTLAAHTVRELVYTCARPAATTYRRGPSYSINRHMFNPNKGFA